MDRSFIVTYFYTTTPAPHSPACSALRCTAPLTSALDPQVVDSLVSARGLRLRRGLRHLPTPTLLPTLLRRRSSVCARVGGGSALRLRWDNGSAKTHGWGRQWRWGKVGVFPYLDRVCLRRW